MAPHGINSLRFQFRCRYFFSIKWLYMLLYRQCPCLLRPQVNSLWSSDAWWQYVSTLAQVMAWQHQSITWTIVDFSSKRFCGIHVRAFYTSTKATVLSNKFKNYAFRIIATSPRWQWVNSLWPGDATCSSARQPLFCWGLNMLNNNATNFGQLPNSGVLPFLYFPVFPVFSFIQICLLFFPVFS